MYGEPSWDNKEITYRLLRDLHAQSTLPWVAIGDFNEILYSSEKEGRAPRQQAMMQLFQDARNDCSLEDIGYNGDKFTFFRGGLRERLDRAVSNPGWMDMHPLCGLVTWIWAIRTTDLYVWILNTWLVSQLNGVGQEENLRQDG